MQVVSNNNFNDVVNCIYEMKDSLKNLGFKEEQLPNHPIMIILSNKLSTMTNSNECLEKSLYEMNFILHASKP